jgi:hypothetical protein
MGDVSMKRFVTLLVLLLLFAPTVFGLSASIGNAKVVLRVDASPEEPAIIPRTIRVNNKNDIPVRVQLAPDSVMERYVTIQDNDFILQANQSANARFTIMIDHGGTVEGRINVGFSPEDPESKENSVGLSSTITIIATGPEPEEPIEDMLDRGDEIPEDYEEDQEEIIEDEEEELEEEEEIIEDDDTESDDGVSVSLGGSPNDGPPEDDSSKSSPIIGILIIAIIISIGIVILLIMKVIRK